MLRQLRNRHGKSGLLCVCHGFCPAMLSSAPDGFLIVIILSSGFFQEVSCYGVLFLSPIGCFEFVFITCLVSAFSGFFPGHAPSLCLVHWSSPAATHPGHPQMSSLTTLGALSMPCVSLVWPLVSSAFLPSHFIWFPMVSLFSSAPGWYSPVFFQSGLVHHLLSSLVSSLFGFISVFFLSFLWLSLIPSFVSSFWVCSELMSLVCLV